MGKRLEIFESENLEILMTMRDWTARKILHDLSLDHYAYATDLDYRTLKAKIMKTRVIDQRKSTGNPIKSLPVLLIAHKQVPEKQLSHISLVRKNEHSDAVLKEVIRIKIDEREYTAFEYPSPLATYQPEKKVIGWSAVVQGSGRNAALTDPTVIQEEGERGNGNFEVNFFGVYAYSLGSDELRAETFSCSLPLKDFVLFPAGTGYWLLDQSVIQAAGESPTASV